MIPNPVTAKTFFKNELLRLPSTTDQCSDSWNQTIIVLLYHSVSTDSHLIFTPSSNLPPPRSLWYSPVVERLLSASQFVFHYSCYSPAAAAAAEWEAVLLQFVIAVPQRWLWAAMVWHFLHLQRTIQSEIPTKTPSRCCGNVLWLCELQFWNDLMNRVRAGQRSAGQDTIEKP